MIGWRAELSSRKMLSYYTVPSSSYRTWHSVLPFIFYKYGRMLENYFSYWSYFLFNKKQAKNKKDTTLWQKVCCSTTHQIALSSLWPQPVGKLEAFVAEMENNSTFTKTKDCRQHALVTCAKWALQMGRLLVTVRIVNVIRLE